MPATRYCSAHDSHDFGDYESSGLQIQYSRNQPHENTKSELHMRAVVSALISPESKILVAVDIGSNGFFQDPFVLTFVVRK